MKWDGSTAYFCFVQIIGDGALRVQNRNNLWIRLVNGAEIRSDPIRSGVILADMDLTKKNPIRNVIR